MIALASVAVLVCGPAVLPASAQLAVPPPMPAYQYLSDQQLEQLLGPIALYPDPLLAIILPAATLPTQVVMADRYVSGGGDPNAIDQQPWDSSVQALARYPSVLSYMDNNLNWTIELGQAFLNQQQAVMDSVQRLRISAQNYGNLVSTPQAQVVYDNGQIEILPADPYIIYVPVYQPQYVYYQRGFGCGFGAAFSIGAWLDHDFDWHNHHVFEWDRNHPRPASWWHERPEQRTAWMARRGTEWRPENHRDHDAARRGDRGWVDQSHNRAPAPQDRPYSVVHMNTTTIQQHPMAQPRPMAEPRPMAHPRPAATRDSGAVHGAAPAPASRPNFNGAFGGNESSRDARDFSNRGHESTQTPRPGSVHSAPPVSRPAPSAPPVSHPAPSAPSGGGSHGGGSQPHH